MSSGEQLMADELKPFYKELGELNSEVKVVASRLDQHILDSKESTNVLFEKIDNINTHVCSLNSVERKLLDIGIDVSKREECQKDMAYLRETRKRKELRSNWIERIIVITVTTAAVAFLTAAVYEKILRETESDKKMIYEEQRPSG